MSPPVTLDAVFRRFIDNLEDPATICRATRDDTGALVDWTIEGANPLALAQLGVEAAEGRSGSEFFPASESVPFLQVVAQVLADGRSRTHERRLHGRQFECRVSALHRDSWSEVCRDVTSERLEPAALRDRKSRSFAFEWTPADDRVRRSANCASLFGLEGRAAVEDTGHDFFQRLHADDRQRFLGILHALTPGSPRYETTYRIVKPDGAITTVEESGEAAFDSEGRVVRLIGITTDVTEVEAAERAVRESEQRLSVAKEAAGLGIHDWDVASGTLRWDARVRELFGARDDEPITYETFVDGVHPDDRERADAEIRRALEPGGEGRCYVEYRCRNRRDGVERWIGATGQAFFENGRAIRLVGTVQDITERKRIEDALRASEARFRTVVEHSLDGINMLDLATGRYVFMSPAQVAMMGFSAEELENLTAEQAAERVHPDDRDVSVAQQRAIASGGEIPRTIEYRWRLKSGEYRWFSDSRKLVRDEHGRPAALVGVSRDVTDRKRSEDALAEADRRKDEFLATLSHELRNPLAPVRFAVPMLKRESMSDDGARAVGVIERQVNHLSRLVDDLLDVSRISRGKVVLQRQRLALDAALHAAVEAASPAIIERGHRFTLSIPASPAWLHADPARVSQIFTNLLHNAAKFTPRGGDIVLEAAVDDRVAVVRVRDTGPGIPDEALPRVFDMFVQVNQQDTRTDGLGIGLALSRRLVEMHGGTIEVARGPAGRGTEFLVRLPLASEGELVEPAHAPDSAPPRRRLRVLIVDDNADLVDMLALVVEADGHESIRACDGRSGIAAAVEGRPDVILLDLGLPDLDGCDVARAIRQEPLLGGVFLVALTGWGQDADRRRTRDAGFDQHLTKPADPARVTLLLNEVATAARQAGHRA